MANIGFLPDGVTFRRLDRGGGNKTEAVVNLTGPEINANNQDPKIVSCVLAAALYPNVVQVLPGNRAKLIIFSTHLNCFSKFAYFSYKQILTPKAKYKATAAGAVLKPFSPEDIKFRTKADGYVNIHPSSGS